MYSLRPNDQRARMAVIFLIIQIILLGATALSNYLELSMYQDLQSAVSPDMERIEMLSFFQAIFWLFYILTFIATIIMFIMWFRRAYYNLGQIVKTETTDGWAAGAWFIPFYNLVKPKQIMDELYHKTNRILKQGIGSYSQKSAEIVTIWWILWIVSNIASNISSRMYLNAEEIPEYIRSLQLSLFTDLFSIAPAVLAILVIKRYASMEYQLVNIKKPETVVVPTEAAILG